MSFIKRHGGGGNVMEQYLHTLRFRKSFILFLLVLAAIVTFVSFAIGSYRIGFMDCMHLIFDRIFGEGSGSVLERVMWESRIPRGLCAVFVGGGLAAAGCVMQSMMRNPLADPYTTGVSSGAGLGVALVVVTGISIVPGIGTTSMILNAFLFSLIPAGIILLMSIRRKITSTTMILIGIGVMYVFSACTQLLRLVATPNQIEQMYRWQLGSLSEMSFGNLTIVAVAVVVCVMLLYRYKRDLNLLTLGDNSALTLGTDPWKTRVKCLVIVSFMTAVCVCFTGTIGFVGLVAPQMVRILIGSDSHYLIPASLAFGAVFLVACDSLSRVVGVAGLPVGIITAFIGSPLFVYMLVKQARKDKLRG